MEACGMNPTNRDDRETAGYEPFEVGGGGGAVAIPAPRGVTGFDCTGSFFQGGSTEQGDLC